MTERQGIAMYMLVSLGDQPGAATPIAAAVTSLLEACELYPDEVKQVVLKRAGL